MQTAIYLSIPLSIPVHSLFVFFLSFFLIVFSLVLFLHLSRLPNASTPDRKSNAGPSEISEFLLGLVVGRLFFPPPSTRKPWQEKRNISTRARRTTKVIEYSSKCPEYFPTPPIALSCLPLVWIFPLHGRHGTTLAAGSPSTQRNETGASPWCWNISYTTDIYNGNSSKCEMCYIASNSPSKSSSSSSMFPLIFGITSKLSSSFRTSISRCISQIRLRVFCGSSTHRGQIKLKLDSSTAIFDSQVFQIYNLHQIVIFPIAFIY